MDQAFTRTHTRTPILVRTHTQVLAVLSVGTDIQLVFVSQQSPLMFSSIFHAAVPFRFLPSRQNTDTEPVSGDVQLI